MPGASLRDIALPMGWSVEHPAKMIRTYAAMNPLTAGRVLARLDARG